MRLAALTLLVGTSVGATAEAAPTYTYTDYNAQPISSYDLSDINDLGQIVGYTSFTGTGYLLDPASGQLTVIAVPPTMGYSIAPFGLNDLGQIVGSFVDLTNHTRGFLRDPVTGALTVLPTPPGFAADAAVIPSKINNAGQITVQISSTPTSIPLEGVYDLRSGQFTFYPSPVLPGYPYYPLSFFLGEIDNAGQALITAGTGGGRNAYPLRYLLDLASGNYTRLADNVIVDFNALGQQIGNTTDPTTGNSVGFVQDPDGSSTTILDPASSTGSVVAEITDAGRIFGYYSDALGLHEFVATPVDVAVPEPPTYAVVCFGLFGLCLTRLGRANSSRQALSTSRRFIPPR